jgi:hypothetical protein
MKERAIRLVVERKHEYDSEFVAIVAISKTDARVPIGAPADERHSGRASTVGLATSAPGDTRPWMADHTSRSKPSGGGVKVSERRIVPDLPATTSPRSYNTAKTAATAANRPSRM